MILQKFDNGIKAYSAYFLSNKYIGYSAVTRMINRWNIIFIYMISKKMKLIKKITDDGATQKEDIYIYNDY